jgi:RNA chaperone Hfq
MESNLLDRMLNTYLEAQTPVAITLQNNVRVSGRVKAYDSYVIVVEGQKREIVYRHAVSCVAAAGLQDPRRVSGGVKTPPAKATLRPPKPAVPQGGKRPSAPTMVTASTDQSINTAMKEALLKWMQEQKSAK